MVTSPKDITDSAEAQCPHARLCALYAGSLRRTQISFSLRSGGGRLRECIF